MPRAYMLQPWIALNGSAGYVFTQADGGYLRIGDHRDMIVHVEVSQVSGTPTLKFQTAPTRSDTDFIEVDALAAFTMNLGVTNVTLNSATVATPLSHYLRYNLTAAGAYSATFRIWLSLTS